jgi:hypothetical protein
MFGNTPGNGNENGGGIDPVKQAMANRNLGFSPPKIPEGQGVYELDRVWTRMSAGFKGRVVPLFCARLACVEHENPAHVGKVFGWTMGLGNDRPLAIVLEVMTKFLVLLFGEEAKKQIASPAVDQAIEAAYRDNFKAIVESQAFAGQPLKGRRIRINGVKTAEPDDKGKFYVNCYFDCA